MKKDSSVIIIAVFLNLLVFAFILICTKPIYDTNEDVYILYLLSGSFGFAPTELLHYNYGLHPLLGWILKNLFLLDNNINWYAITLLFFHFVACTIICSQILLHNSKFYFISACLAILIIFECRFMLNLNFTNTALVTGCSGLVLLVRAAKN